MPANKLSYILWHCSYVISSNLVEHAMGTLGFWYSVALYIHKTWMEIAKHGNKCLWYSEALFASSMNSIGCFFFGTIRTRLPILLYLIGAKRWLGQANLNRHFFKGYCCQVVLLSTSFVEFACLNLEMATMCRTPDTFWNFYSCQPQTSFYSWNKSYNFFLCER